MSTPPIPPGPGFPAGRQGQNVPPPAQWSPGYPQGAGQGAPVGQPQSPQYGPPYPQGQQYPQVQPQFPQAPGFPPGVGYGGPPSGQPHQVPPAPVGQPAPKKKGRLVAILVAVLVVLGGVAVKVVLGLGIGAAIDSTNQAHTTNVGDCASVTGTVAKPHYEKVDCGSGKENYTVGKVLNSASATCPQDYDEYYETGVNSVKLCLIPVLKDGACYDFGQGSVGKEQMGYSQVPCSSSKAVQVKVLKGTTDKNACGADSDSAVVYQETRTTICLTASTGA
ncbi:MAG: hypothetical protein JOZ47_01445 [Kutzneria sp.]|nr:hypothetical protein [Kutzneria sp.]